MPDDIKPIQPTPQPTDAGRQATPQAPPVDNPQDVVDQVLGEEPTEVKPLAFAESPTPQAPHVGGQATPTTPQLDKQTLPPLTPPLPPNVPKTPTPPPPATAMPAGLTPTPIKMVEPKKKGGKSKVAGVVTGIVILLVAVVGGLFGYAYLIGESSMIALIGGNTGSCTADAKQTIATCVGTCVDNGYKGVGEACKWSAKGCVNAGWVCDGPVDKPPTADVNTKSGCEGKGYAWCDGCGGFCNMTTDKGCYVLAKDKCGEGQITGVSCSITQTDVYNYGDAYDEDGNRTSGIGSCNCDGVTLYFDRPGICNPGDGNGLCFAADRQGCEGDGGTNDLANYAYNCTNTGCSTTDSRCSIYYWTCDSNSLGGYGCQDGTPIISSSASFAQDCGAEQIDVDCGGNTVDHRFTTYEEPCEDVYVPPLEPRIPTLSCTSLTKDVASPEIGDEIVLTCAGSVVPAGATSLAYDFRYRRDLGEWFDLTANGVNATFTIALAGEYDVQCRACGMIENASVCDPTWIGVGL